MSVISLDQLNIDQIKTEKQIDSLKKEKIKSAQLFKQTIRLLEEKSIDIKRKIEEESHKRSMLRSK